MKIKYWAISFLYTALLIGGVFAQTAPQTKRAPKFSSVYTDLRKDCKDAWSGREREEALARGQDIPQQCKGFGGYYAYISYSAVEEYLSIVKNSNEDDFILLRPKDSKFIEQAGGKIEWRLADGKPFAVIVRFAHYQSDDSESGVFEAKNKRGESLLVKGLEGFERIDFETGAKTPDANQRARDLADAAFLKD